MKGITNVKLNRGSISVTGDGSKTYSTLLTSLWNSIDITKVSSETVLEQVLVSGNTLTFTINGYGPQFVRFANIVIDTANLYSKVFGIGAAHSYVNAVNTTYTNQLNNVVASGEVLRIVY